MKKFILLMILLIMVLGLFACGEKSTDDKFLKDLAIGLQDRWDLNNDDTDEELTNELVDAELIKISKYKDAEFEDKKLQELAINYISMLEQQNEALTYITSDILKFDKLWSEAYNERSKIIVEINDKYDLPIDSKHEKDLSVLIDNEKGVKSAEKLEKQLNEMLNAGDFSKVENYGSYDCTLTVENTIDRDFSYFEVNINFLDADSVIIESTVDSVENWNSGTKNKFNFYVDSDFDKYEVSVGYYEEE
ncbi:MAG: FxLYD domain-containing protein [Anaerovoracaceae bacterium]